jgi:hypothetical protein
MVESLLAVNVIVNLNKLHLHPLLPVKAQPAKID